jgi:chaperonin cofactor prefoldin
MHKDADTNATVRQCIDTKLQSVTMRAEKAEAELKSVHRANVDMNLQEIKIKAELSQLHEDNECAR